MEEVLAVINKEWLMLGLVLLFDTALYITALTVSKRSTEEEVEETGGRVSTAFFSWCIAAFSSCVVTVFIWWGLAKDFGFGEWMLLQFLTAVTFVLIFILVSTKEPPD
ncbi:MAG: hypothetical protein ABII72_00995 [Parcubacteria group bacterium]